MDVACERLAAECSEVFTAPSMGGPWTSIGNPTFSATGYNSQVSYILPLGIEHGHERFLCAADRFDPYINTSESGRYVWNPLEVFRERSRRAIVTMTAW